MSDLLAVLVILPFLAAVAPLVLARRFDGVGWPVAAVALVAQSGLAGLLAWRVFARGPVSLVVGRLPAELGIELGADALSAPFVLLVALTGLWGLAYTRRGGPRSATGYALYLLLVAGLTGICVTRDVFNLYVFLEVSGLSAYALVALGDDDAAPAALQYLLVGTVGASLYLLGVGYAYAATGQLNVGALGSALARAGYGNRLVLASFALVAAGLAVKVALYPVHTWKPRAYAAAPPGIAAVLAALVSTVAAYALGRVLLSVFGAAFLAANPPVDLLLRVALSASVVAGAVLALRQRDVRRMLAYSGVSQFGIAVAGFVVGTPTGVVGAVVHLLGHAVLKGGAFVVAGALAASLGARRVDDYAGVAADRPVAAAAMATLGLGLVGIPPLVGFFGKWYVTLGAIEAEAWGVAAAVLVSTLLSLSYFGRLIQRMYLEAGPDGRTVGSVSRGMLLAGVVAAVAALALGLLSGSLATALEPAAREVLVR
jgi:multicomponent Na+:H+ antiporter subunit D